MTPQIRLVLAIHDHQPVGNFDGVFEDATRDSYVPFLDALEEYGEIPVSLHTSGSLLEWLVDAHPEYIDRLRALTDRGQIEILGGPFYEPILAGIPREDRIGQIRAYSRYLEQLFGHAIRGMWVPERVWEQSFVSDIATAGIEYTLVDDFHFRSVGLAEDDLFGYYLTEDDGHLLKIFPGSEKLRYTIPFADPQDTIDYLRSIAERRPNAVVTFGDDGEKFGTWPGTKKHVYDDGWLRSFFDALRANQDWIKICTLAEAVDSVSPAGTIYLPDASYREMTEWALPTARQTEYSELTHRKEGDPDWASAQQFMRGGFWRNFRVKYPESNEMYVRMLEVSRCLREIAESPAGREQPDRIAEARSELYRGQCNCSYWHGAFGGLYLPHLRNAVYRHLIAADTILESISGRAGRWVEVRADDFDLDARKEIRIAGDRLVAYLAPSRGGHLYELDVRSIRHNLLATLDRREEPYHRKVIEAASQQTQSSADGVASIHDLVHFKQPDLDKKIVYDRWRRKSLVDHFMRPGLTRGEFERGEGCLGDFESGVYQSVLKHSDQRVEVEMSRETLVGHCPVRVTKSVALDVASCTSLEISYALSNLPPGETIHFGIEFNFAGLAAGADDRYFYNAEGQQLGQLETVHSLDSTDRIGMVDEWIGVDVSLELSEPGPLWLFPIQTISQSEGGFELVHQSCAVVPHWEFVVPQDGTWRSDITLRVDTSAAQARQLAKVAATTT